MITKFLVSEFAALSLVAINFLVFFINPNLKNYSGLSIAVAGLIIYLYNLFIMGKSWSIDVRANKLVTDGFFKYIRHPLYLGSMIICLGLIIMSYNAYLLILFLLIDLPFVWFKSRFEEEFLKKNMKGYKDYMKKTYMFIPKII